MTSLLVEWVNDELQLEPPLTEETLAEELGSGFILGALLHRHNQLAEHERLIAYGQTPGPVAAEDALLF